MFGIPVTTLAWGLGLGASLAVLWIVSLLLELLIQHAWAWMDDGNKDTSYLVRLAMKPWGYEYCEADRWDSWRKKGDSSTKSDGSIGVFGTLLVLFWGPILLSVGLLVYPVTLVVISLVLLAFLTRFSRRLYKRFEKHEQDPNAHGK